MAIPRTAVPLAARAALVAALGWLVALAAYAAAPPPRCALGAGDDVGCARGFQTREGAGGRPFRWTDSAARVELAGAGWWGARALAVTLAAPRPPGAPPARVALSAGGARATFEAPAAPRRYLILAPPAPLSDSAAVDIAADTFVPPGDDRDLGAMVFEVRQLPLPAPRLPGLALLLALPACALAAARLLGEPGSRARPAAALGALALLGCGLALAPGRVAPFLPGLAALLALAAWLLPRRAGEGLPAAAWGCALAGAALDGLLAAGPAPAGLTALGVAAQGALGLAAVWAAGGAPGSAGEARPLLRLALALRLAGMAARLLAGAGAADPDTELFYNYGRATIELGAPIAEYPSGALLAWAALALPASRELFALLLPLLNAACDAAVVWAVWRVGRASSGPASPAPRLLALAYASASLLLPFWHGKYDPLPAALAALALAAFAAGRPLAAGAALGLGGAVKWAPWLAAPALGLELLRGRGGWRRAGALAAGLGLAVLAASLPVALRGLEGFLAPYVVQGARPLIGESVWFLPAALLEPGLAGRLGAPWSGTESKLITPALTLAAQAAALGALGLAQLLRPPGRRRALALAALAPAVFLLLNRVYSPQYALPIGAGLLAAGAATLATRRQALALAALLAGMQAANQLVWPHTQGWWLPASALQFACALAAAAWLAHRAWLSPVEPAEQAPPPS